MTREPMTLEEIGASRPDVDRAQDRGDDGKGYPPTPDRGWRESRCTAPAVPAGAEYAGAEYTAIRAKLRMTQQAFGTAIGVPVTTVRNWKQLRTGMDPAVRSLLRIVECEPDTARRALAG